MHELVTVHDPQPEHPLVPIVPPAAWQELTPTQLSQPTSAVNGYSTPLYTRLVHASVPSQSASAPAGHFVEGLEVGFVEGLEVGVNVCGLEVGFNVCALSWGAFTTILKGNVCEGVS